MVWSGKVSPRTAHLSWGLKAEKPVMQICESIIMVTSEGEVSQYVPEAISKQLDEHMWLRQGIKATTVKRSKW